MKIGLFLSDNQFIEGIFRDIKEDHIIVDVNEKLLYFSLQHVRALSKNAKDFCVSPNIIPHLDRNYLADILKELKYSMVTINCLGSQAFFGVLSSISEDHIIIINNKEQLYIQKAFISSIYKGMYESHEEDTDSKQEKATQESSSHVHNEGKEQSNSSLDDDIQDSQQDVSIPKQKTNQNEPDIHAERPPRGKRTKRSTEVEKIDDQRLQIGSDKAPDLQSSRSTLNEMQFVFTEPDFKINRKNKDLINPQEVSHDLHANEYKSNTTNKINELANREGDSIRKERRFKSYHSLSKLYSKMNSEPDIKKKDINIEKNKEREKNTQLVEKKVTSPPVKRLSIKEEKEMLEQQYYALMKHAEKMYHNLRDERFGV